MNLQWAARIKQQSIYRDFDVRAVRGPLTKRALEASGYKVPAVFGDPAILMTDIYQPSQTEKKYDCSLVLHLRYIKEVEGLHQISIATDDWKQFIDEIAASKKVISSSMHGIILAELYGVPAVFLCEDLEKEDIFKYYDYYYSTKRYNVKIASTVEEALAMEPMELPQNLDELRQGLRDSFPYDLWEKK